MSLIQLKNVSYQYDESPRPVFSDLTLTIHPGITSFVGQNGSGKTTLLLLAGARLVPDEGRVTLLGRDTAEFKDEESRNLLASFIYQNMEFETEDPVGVLFEQIYSAGAHDSTRPDLIRELIRIFELEEETGKRTGQLSKGALQRTIIIFSLLYGSPVVIMDEPLFAVEQKQREGIMEYLCDYSLKTHTSFLYSAHELQLTRSYSDQVLLFDKHGGIRQGKPTEILTNENLENAYGIPAAMLKEKENLHRQHLLEVARHIQGLE